MARRSDWQASARERAILDYAGSRRERHVAAQRKYRAAHLEEDRARSRAYHTAHREVQLAKQRAYYTTAWWVHRRSQLKGRREEIREQLATLAKEEQECLTFLRSAIQTR